MNRTGMAMMTMVALMTSSAGDSATRRKQVQTQAKAVAAMRFDLECSGMLHPWNSDPSTSWKETFRVDTKTNKWCRGRCGTTKDIGTIDEDRLAFHDSHSGVGGPPGVETVIMRMDGEIRERLMLGTPTQSKVVVEGFCTRVPFTGFGERKF
jgi:hypothetical protein